MKNLLLIIVLTCFYSCGKNDIEELPLGVDLQLTATDEAQVIQTNQFTSALFQEATKT
ncbi:hypothetical protein [Sphingobacterium hungaricum]|uniref:hypothetical protein n=1 Tax=Sphingobacterium hungaricum TaxID=2082723 RepID=UPI0018CAE038|nr:hypothetical protein [Sphingobacterium hungaricum]